MKVRCTEQTRPYLTPDKWYEAKQRDPVGTLFQIVDDEGARLLICLTGCTHLDGGDWETWKQQ